MKLKFIKKFFKNEKGQAFIEAILFFMLVYIFVVVALIHFGIIQLLRERMEIANSYLGYTTAIPKHPNIGDSVVNKTLQLLKKGTPSIYNGKHNIKNIIPVVKGNSHFVIKSMIKGEYIFQSSIMRDISGQSSIKINSHPIIIKSPMFK